MSEYVQLAIPLKLILRFLSFTKTDIGFIDQNDDEDVSKLLNFIPSLIEENKYVTGFFGSCVPLDAVMMADFTCLYNETCLDLLLDYFPNLTKVLIGMYQHQTSRVLVSTELFGIGIDGIGIAGIEALKDRPC
jgi:hypothetical protein